jgi:hypothetical protein
LCSKFLPVEQQAACLVAGSQPCSADLLPSDPSQPDLMVKMNVRREICLPATFYSAGCKYIFWLTNMLEISVQFVKYSR